MVEVAAPVTAAKSPRKPNKHWMGNFLEFFSSKSMYGASASNACVMHQA